jgi:hypothetical protein
MSMTREERAKRMDKIKKCLALSRSPEPHEAAAALRQAQKLMEQLGVSAEEVLAPEVDEVTVKTREGFGKCRYMAFLADVICKAFGVRSIFKPNPGSANRLNVSYYGPAGRVKLAEYSHRVIARALQASWEKFLQDHPWKKSVGGARTSFYQAWIVAVSGSIQALVPSPDEDAAVDRFVAVRYPGMVKWDKMAKAKHDPHAAGAGRAAAEGFTLSVPVGAEAQKLQHRPTN